MDGPDWKDRLPDEVWKVFPNCVVMVDGELLGTRNEMAMKISRAFEPDEDGRLPNDPSLAIIRRINSVTV